MSESWNRCDCELSQSNISHTIDNKNDVPAVSILVTVYNRQDYLEQTLRSVLASSYSDFEVIVVDDCSSDQSLKIAESIAREDDRIRLVKNDENLGDYGNRKKAASLARGTYLKYVDSDDLIYPHTLQVMVNAMEQHPETGFALSHSLPEDDEPYPWVLTPEESFHKHFLGRGCFACGPTGAIIRRTAFEEVGGFRPEWKVLSDVDLWLRLAARWPVALMPPGLVWWRRHPDQEFTKDDAAAVYLELGHKLDLEALTATGSPLDESARLAALRKRKQHHARRLLSLALRQRHPVSAGQLFKRSELTLLDLAKGLCGYDS